MKIGTNILGIDIFFSANLGFILEAILLEIGSIFYGHVQEVGTTLVIMWERLVPFLMLI